MKNNYKSLSENHKVHISNISIIKELQSICDYIENNDYTFKDNKEIDIFFYIKERIKKLKDEH